MNTTKLSLRLAAALGLLPWAVLQAAPQANTAPPSASDQKEFYSYTLTMDKIRKLAATEKSLDDLRQSDPQLAKSLESDNSGAADLGLAAQKLEKYPQVIAIIKKQGLTPRTYIVCTIAFIQSVTAVGLKKNGTFKDYPPQVRQAVSPANLTFVEQNWDQIAKVMPSFGGGNTAPQQ